MTKDDLIAFEKDIRDAFERGEIRAPVHLAGGNEDELIKIFEGVREQDWVCGQWRSHYHCLLKGVPPDELKDAIHRGRSIGLCFPRQRVICSAIVGGIASIATGLAMGIKRRGADEKVWCFLGDMTMRAGITHEAIQYAAGHDLPITFVAEDNGMSVCTDTQEAWGHGSLVLAAAKVDHYSYRLDWPHVGTGKFIRF